MEKFQGKYRIPSARAPFWDYSADGSYFITVCTAGREKIFGEIKNGVMHLSPIGEIVRQEWEKSFILRPELFCDAFVIMPNHIHAILRINRHWSANLVETHGSASVKSHAETHGSASDPPHCHADPPHCHADPPRCHAGETHCRASLPRRSPKSISSFMGGFKSAVTRRINEYHHGKRVWQTRFYDHIIRNDQEFDQIKKYIMANPENWEKDKFI